MNNHATSIAEAAGTAKCRSSALHSDICHSGQKTPLHFSDTQHLRAEFQRVLIRGIQNGFGAQTCTAPCTVPKSEATDRLQIPVGFVPLSGINAAVSVQYFGNC